MSTVCPNNSNSKIIPRHVKWGLSALLVLFIAIPPLFFIPGSFKGRWIFTEYREAKLAALTVLFWALASFYSLFLALKRINIDFKPLKEPTLWFLCFLCIYSLFSILWAPVKEAALYESLQWITLTFMYVVLTTMFLQEPAWARLALMALTGTFLVVTAIGLVQMHVNIPFLRPIPGTRFGSTFGAKNTCFLSVASQFFLLYFTCWVAILRKKKFLGIILGLCVILEFIYIAISLSRTSYAAMSIGFLTLMVISGALSKNKVLFLKRSMGIALVMLMAIATIYYGFPAQWHLMSNRVSKRIIPLLSRPDTYLFQTSRGQVILDSLEMIKDHPLGVGAGNWIFEYPLYRNRLNVRAFNRRKQITRVHNDYIQYLAELGFPGFLALFGLIGIQFKKLICFMRQKSLSYSKEDKILAVLLCSQFTAVCVMLLFSFYLEFPYRKFLFVFLITLIYFLTCNEERRKELYQ